PIDLCLAALDSVAEYRPFSGIRNRLGNQRIWPARRLARPRKRHYTFARNRLEPSPHPVADRVKSCAQSLDFPYVLLPSSIGWDPTLSRWRERFDSARERHRHHHGFEFLSVFEISPKPSGVVWVALFAL